MSRTCELTATSVRYGHNVSHSERKTSRTFRPNLHEKRLFSDSLKIFVRMRITPNALKTVELKGGLDNSFKIIYYSSYDNYLHYFQVYQYHLGDPRWSPFCLRVLWKLIACSGRCLWPWFSMNARPICKFFFCNIANNCTKWYNSAIMAIIVTTQHSFGPPGVNASLRGVSSPSSY